MNHHRLAAHAALILFGTSLAAAFPACEEYAAHDERTFGAKVNQSPIILFGTSLNKNIDYHIPNLFNVTFLVHCILKGRPTHRIIHIVQAGRG